MYENDSSATTTNATATTAFTPCVSHKDHKDHRVIGGHSYTPIAPPCSYVGYRTQGLLSFPKNRILRTSLRRLQV